LGTQFISNNHLWNPYNEHGMSVRLNVRLRRDIFELAKIHRNMLCHSKLFETYLNFVSLALHRPFPKTLKKIKELHEPSNL